MPFDKMSGPEVWERPAVWSLEDYKSPLNGASDEELSEKHKLLAETGGTFG